MRNELYEQELNKLYRELSESERVCTESFNQ